MSPISSIQTALRCRCPRCGQGRMFVGYLKLAKQCDRCGLDYGFAEPADGPAFFVMTGVSLLVIGGWTWWAIALEPPVWLQLVVVVGSLVAGCLAALRPVKAWIVAEQFVHKAGEPTYQSLGDHGTGGFALNRRLAAEREYLARKRAEDEQAR